MRMREKQNEILLQRMKIEKFKQKRRKQIMIFSQGILSAESLKQVSISPQKV